MKNWQMQIKTNKWRIKIKILSRAHLINIIKKQFQLKMKKRETNQVLMLLGFQFKLVKDKLNHGVRKYQLKSTLLNFKNKVRTLFLILWAKKVNQIWGHLK